MGQLQNETMKDGGFVGMGNELDNVDCFSNMLDFWDIPMESLEGDDLEGDWFPDFEDFGPIPSDVLSGLPPVGMVGGLLSSSPESGVLKGKTSQVKREPGSFGELFSSNIHHESSNDSGRFQAHSPMSVLENSKTWVRRSARSKRRRASSAWSKILLPTPRVISKEIKRPNPRGTKKCSHCEITETPQWREGPLGPKTLCNACGVRYRSGRLFPEYRPAASPTFVPSLHSNSHRKVIEMRSKAIGKGPEMRPQTPTNQTYHSPSVL